MAAESRKVFFVISTIKVSLWGHLGHDLCSGASVVHGTAKLGISATRGWHRPGSQAGHRRAVHSLCAGSEGCYVQAGAALGASYPVKVVICHCVHLVRSGKLRRMKGLMWSVNSGRRRTPVLWCAVGTSRWLYSTVVERWD